MRGVHFKTCPECWGAGSFGSGLWYRRCETCQTWGIVVIPGASFDVKTRYGIISEEAA